MTTTSPGGGALPPYSPKLLAVLAGGLPLVLVGGAVFLSLFVWVFCRIEPGSEEIAILIHKTGKDLPPNQIIATDSRQKGIQFDVLPEGRYFRNPYSWEWKIARITDIPEGKFGVVTRLYGEDLPEGRILAGPGTKGIVPEVLQPGKYRINPYASKVELFDAISIRPGHGGVVTSLVGDDLFGKDIPTAMRNAFIAAPGYKGVQPSILEPGTYYDKNPYMYSVAEVNLQSQRFEMSGEDAINFLTVDGFTVHVEGTIEYALIPGKVAQLTQQVGDMDDVIKKIIMPPARGFSRIEGSKNPAKNYITGETRQRFQDNLESHLKAKCLESGVAIRSVLIRNITPPDQIASVIRDREVAVQNAHKIEQQITQAKSQAELTRQEMLAQQNKEKVEADTVAIRAIIAAQQDQEVRLIAARQELEVAKLETAAAAAQADALLLQAEAEKKVIALDNEAQASVISNQTQAFSGGMNFARYAFYQKMGPQIQTILTSDDESGLGALFRPFLTIPSKESK
ncbi:MAG: SPFH domain-containing protein [Chthoniobacteraceae bacterium]|nr:SPFH domain-containing protein [Chthoniobacteraceae bacterium]